MQLSVEKRITPRIAPNVFIKLLPGNIEGKVVNISEAGICFDHEGQALSGDISISIALSASKSKQLTEIPVKVAWNKILSNNKFQVGARFSALDDKCLSQVRDFIFNSFAQKASVAIKEDNEVKAKVHSFFTKDIRKYMENISELIGEINEGKSEPDKIETKLTVLTNEFMLKGCALENAVDDDRQMKKVKQVFRELTGHLFYKSPIMKMAYDRPRGYPGDFELFEILYNDKPLLEDKSIGYYYDRYFLTNAYAKAARARKNKMENILRDLIENDSRPTLRLLNVACGPSREIRELMCDPVLAARKKIIFTGLDNDADSLEFSESALKNLPPNIKLKFLNENVLNIFRNDKYYELIGKQDIVYILGLTEYLPDRVFKRLIHFLWKLLDDKGTLVITYKDKDIVFPSVGPDWIADWAFIKRSKEDLLNAAKELGPDKYSLKIVKRRHRLNLFSYINQNLIACCNGYRSVITLFRVCSISLSLLDY